MELLARSEYSAFLLKSNKRKASVIIANQYIGNKFSFGSFIRKSIKKTDFKIGYKTPILFKKCREGEEEYYERKKEFS
jgi:hypothetical protein